MYDNNIGSVIIVKDGKERKRKEEPNPPNVNILVFFLTSYLYQICKIQSNITDFKHAPSVTITGIYNQNHR